MTVRSNATSSVAPVASVNVAKPVSTGRVLNDVSKDAPVGKGDNSKGDISALISSILNGAKEDNNRQAKLVLHMFNSEVSFGDAWFVNFKKASGKDKTVLIDRSLSIMSDEYADLLKSLAKLEGDKSVDKKQKKLRGDVITRQLLAARAMFKRAASSVYFLRCVNASDVSIRKDGSFNAKYSTNGVSEDADLQQVTGRELTKFGDAKMKPSKVVDKAPAVSTSQEAVASSMLNAFKAANNYASSVAFDKLNDEAGKAANLLLVNLLRMHLADDKGIVNADDVARFVSENVKPVAPVMTAAQAEGVTKASNGVSLATKAAPVVVTKKARKVVAKKA